MIICPWLSCGETLSADGKCWRHELEKLEAEHRRQSALALAKHIDAQILETLKGGT